MQIFKGPRAPRKGQPERQRNPKQLAKPGRVASKADRLVLLAKPNQVALMPKASHVIVLATASQVFQDPKPNCD